MSRTKRKDQIDVQGKHPDFVFFGNTIPAKPNEKDKRKAHMDKKKWYKPGKTFKECQRKKDSTKPKQKFKDALAKGKDWDEVVLPDAKKHDVWDWN